jgi:hypothetical protein
MFDALIVIPHCGLASWRIRNEDAIASIQLGTQTGRFTNGERFRYVVANGESHWMERLRGLRFGRLQVEEGTNLVTHEIRSLQALLQR